MSVSWANLHSQSEKNVLVFLKSVNLSDDVLEIGGKQIKAGLLGCYEHFSTSQLIQTKVFEMLATLLRRSKTRVFDDDLELALHYAKNMLSEWMSSSDVIVNDLKFLTVLFEKEKPGSVDEDLLAQCGEVLKAHSHSIPIQQICLTFICSITRYCSIESFSEKSVLDLAKPVVETIRNSADDPDVIIKALVVMSFLFERVPERLHETSMDALDAVNACLQQHESSHVLAAVAVEFLSLCAVDDMHLIILSSNEKGFGLYNDMCLKFLENNDIKSVLACTVLLKRACGDKIKEITVNSIPGLMKKILSTARRVRDTAASSAVGASPDVEEILQQIVFASDGVLGALDPSYCPDGGLDASYTSKASKSGLPRSSSTLNETSQFLPPKILPRSNSAPIYAAPKPPAVEHAASKSSVSLLSHATVAPILSSKKMKAKRRLRAQAVAVEDNDNASITSEVSVSTVRSGPGSGEKGPSDTWSYSSKSPKSPGSGKQTSFSDILKEEAQKMLQESPAQADRSEIDDIPLETYKKSPSSVPRLNASKGEDLVADDIAAAEGPDINPKKDLIVDKIKTFQAAISSSTTPRSVESSAILADVKQIFRSKSVGESLFEAEQICVLQEKLRDAMAAKKTICDNRNEILEDKEELEQNLHALRTVVEGLQRRVAVSDEARARAEEELLAKNADYAAEQSELQSQCKDLQSKLQEALAANIAIEERGAKEKRELVLIRDDALAELAALRSSLERGAIAEETANQAAAREIESLKFTIVELQLGFEKVQADLENTIAAASEKQSHDADEIFSLQQSNSDLANRVKCLQEDLADAVNKNHEIDENRKRISQLQSVATKSQEQASVAILRVEELHSVLVDATAKIEALTAENSRLQNDLDDALKREETLIQEQEDLIDAYRQDAGNDGDGSVVLVDDDGGQIVVPLGETAMCEGELDSPIEADEEKDRVVLGSYENDDHNSRYDDRSEEEESFFYDQSMRPQKRKKTPTQSAYQGIKSALRYLDVSLGAENSEGNSDFEALMQDLAGLVQEYFQSIVKCPTSDPAKSINHTLRAAALCAALCAPQLGLVDSKKLMRSDVEISIRRQKGVRLFTVYGVAFTMLLCIHKKHKLDTGDNDSQTLLFRLIEMLTIYLEKVDENENLWISSSINQRQGLSSPTRMKQSGCLEDDDLDEEQFTSDDLMAASRLLHKEAKSIQSIFECYPSYASTARSAKVSKSTGAVKGRSLDTVILIAKDFGICPGLMDRTACIHIIGQEIRRSQDDPDWVFPSGDILVSFSQFEIFLMNVALKNKNFGPSNGFVTATQKLAGLLWWMDNSGGKERLHDKDRNFKVCPFRVHGLIPTVKAPPKGEDYWLEK